MHRNHGAYSKFPPKTRGATKIPQQAVGYRFSFLLIIGLFLMIFCSTGHCLDYSQRPMLSVSRCQYAHKMLIQGTEQRAGFVPIVISDSHDRINDSLSIAGYTPKDPRTALVIAAGPGFFVHGAGHFYMGEYKVGAGLLAAELLSLPLWYVSIIHGISEAEGGSIISPDLALASGFSAAVLFFGSYFVDVIGAPSKAHEINRKYEYYYSIMPHLSEGKISLSLSMAL